MNPIDCLKNQTPFAQITGKAKETIMKSKNNEMILYDKDKQLDKYEALKSSYDEELSDQKQF